jgi:CrcB protein
MFRTLLLIGLGGFLGSTARYLFQNFVSKLHTIPFPYGTFLINITGSLLIGLVYGYTERYEMLSMEIRLFVATGFCGGFTTFSTFSFESFNLLKEGNYIYFLIYITGSILFCILAALTGYLAVK